MKIKTRLSPEFSVYLDFLRVFAALMVVVSHYPLFLFQAHITNRYNFGYDAVVVFFVLSGYVISYAADQIEKTWFNYTVSRMARILPVSTMAVLVSLVLMCFAYPYSPESYPEIAQLQKIPYVSIVTMFFANEFWWTDVRPFGNGPYWSLAFEVWCYVIYGLAIFVPGRKRFFLIFIALLITGPKQWLMLPIWLAGSFVYRYRNKFDLSNITLLMLAVVPIFVFFAIQLSQPRDWSYFVVGRYVESFFGHGLDGAANFFWGYILAVLVSIHLYAVNRLGGVGLLNGPLISGVIRKVAGYTFSLYIFHYPMFFFWNALLKPMPAPYDFVHVLIVYVSTFAGVIILAGIVEHKKALYREFFARSLSSFERLVSRRSSV
ncbi:acyltransferase family protein [Pseudomonas sp. McL0111]|uniref:acyltransferase family protein n=1 Tax=Pseudomonas sp. McL0111 TaxID=3457357 RepID=UPI00403E4F20